MKQKNERPPFPKIIKSQAGKRKAKKLAYQARKAGVRKMPCADAMHTNTGIPFFVKLDSGEEPQGEFKVLLSALGATCRELTSDMKTANGKTGHLFWNLPTHTKDEKMAVYISAFIDWFKAHVVQNPAARKMLKSLRASDTDKTKPTAVLLISVVRIVAVQTTPSVQIPKQKLHRDLGLRSRETSIMVQPGHRHIGTEFKWSIGDSGLIRYADTAAFAFDTGHLHAGPSQDIPADVTFPYYGDDRVAFGLVHEKMSKREIKKLQRNDGAHDGSFITPIRIELM